MITIKILFKLYKRLLLNGKRILFWHFLLLVASLLLTLNPDIGLNYIKDIGQEKLKINLNPTYFTINSVLLFTAIWYWVNYFQNILQIENLYTYIHRLEEQLCSMGEIKISREGKSYLEYYPILKNVIHKFYTIFTPLLLIAIISAKGYYEWFVEEDKIPLLSRIIDTVGIFFLIVSTVLYLSWIHFQDFKNN